MARKTIRERIYDVEKEILVIEERREKDAQRLQEKKKKLGELKDEEMLEQLRIHKLSGPELKKLLDQHAHTEDSRNERNSSNSHFNN